MNGFPIFILAQASSGFSDFARQVPTGLIVMFCGSGLLLVAVSFLIVRARSQRTPRAMPEHPYVPVGGAARTTSVPDTGDLPDLDMLVTSPAPPPAARATPPPTRPARPGTFTVTLAEGGTAQAVEVVTVLRDVVDGGLIVQMGDRAFRDLGADETFRGNFLKIMREFAPMVRPTRSDTKPEPLDAMPEERAPAASKPTPQPAVSESGSHSLRDLLIDADALDEEEPEDGEPVFAAPPPPVSTDGKMPGDLPQFSLDTEAQVVKKRSGLFGRTKTEFLPVPELNLAGAIEAYLQHKLKHTPQYAGRSIHVHPSPDGGVAIEVDGEFYDSVGDVADTDVRKFLSGTIEEWQARNARKSGG